MNTSDFFALFSSFNCIMTKPTLKNFIIIVNGWLLATRRRVTDILVASGTAGKRHHSAFHRFFASAQWSLNELGLAVFRLILPLIPADKTIFLAVDDTLARKRGLKVFGAGMHHDPLLSSRKKTVTNWGHSWVVLGVLLQLPFRKGHFFCLPILFRLYRSKQTHAREGGEYKTRPELAVEMLETLCQSFAECRFHVVGDGAYSGKSVVRHLPGNCEMTGRTHLEAGLYAPAPKRKDNARGRSRKKGQKLATPRKMLYMNKTRTVKLNIYGRKEKMKIAERECLWYSVAVSRLLKIVAVKPLSSGRKVQAFFSTESGAVAEEIITWYARRWAIEVTFQDTKGWLGFEEPQGWTRKAVERTAPMGMLFYSMILVWFSRRADHKIDFLKRPWYRRKAEICFVDILRVLRREILEKSFLDTPMIEGVWHKNIETLINLAVKAA